MKRLISIIVLIVFTILAFGSTGGDSSSSSSNSSKVSSCKRECQEGYEKAKQKIRNAGLTPGAYEDGILRDCKRECERNPDW